MVSTLRALAAASAFAATLALSLAGCSGGDGPVYDPAMPNLPAAPAGPPHPDPQALADPRLDAVLAAGTAGQHADDHAALELRDLLAAAGTPQSRLHSLSADPERFGADLYLAQTAEAGGRSKRVADPSALRKLPDGTDPATPAAFLRRVMALDGRAAGACLVYLAATPGGAGLEMRNGSLSPEELDRALAAGCADAPSVIVVSACASGAFAAAPMARPNRLILTAAAAGRSGLGCGANLGLTTFDECFLGAVRGAPSWALVFERTRACVRHRESLLGEASVEPQQYLGAEVAGLPAPWRDDPPGGIARRVEFRQGIGRFSVEAAPYYPKLRQRTRPEFEAYAQSAAPKAMALTFAGTVAWAGPVTGSETPEDAARLALQRCEWRSGGACVLFARNRWLVAADEAGMPPLHRPMLARSGAVEPATVPFIRDDQRAELERYLTLPGPKALALGPDDESLGIGTGADMAEAKSAALGRCRAHGGTCIIFAEGTAIVLGDNTRPPG